MRHYVKRLQEKRIFFWISEDGVSLEEDDRKFFHKIVAKLLYLSKSARPDILTETSFLYVITCTTQFFISSSIKEKKEKDSDG
jgi:hypothetical protein